MKKVVSLLAAAGVLAVASGAMATPYILNDRPVTITDTPGQETLQQVVNGVVGPGKINVSTDQSRVGGWTMAEGNVDAYRIALLAPQATGDLGIYSLATGQSYKLFTANSGAGGFTAQFSIEQNKTGGYDLFVDNKLTAANFGQGFAFYWYDTKSSTHTTSYTMDSLNPGNAAASVAYLVPSGTSVTMNRDSNHTTKTSAQGDNDWIIGFDNQLENYVSGSKSVYDSTTDFNDAVFYLEDMNPVPEPGTMMLLGAGFLGLAIYGKRRKNA